VCERDPYLRRGRSFDPQYEPPFRDYHGWVAFGSPLGNPANRTPCRRSSVIRAPWTPCFDAFEKPGTGVQETNSPHFCRCMYVCAFLGSWDRPFARGARKGAPRRSGVNGRSAFARLFSTLSPRFAGHVLFISMNCEYRVSWDCFLSSCSLT
jgi:hypothetical protein